MGRWWVLSIVAVTLISTPQAMAAAKGGGYALGIQLGLVTAGQAQMNELIKRANTRESGISTGELNSAYEAAVSMMYRFQGTIFAAQLRPSFFYQNQSGSGNGGAFDYGLTGYSIMPILRLYPLENPFMKFYMQFGLGYGRVSGSIEENNTAAPTHGKVDFSGGAFGSMAGLGAEFCFRPQHCISFEGNYRYMNFERLLAGNVSGSFATNSLSQATKGQEVELDSADLAVRMGGLMFMAGYNYWF